MYPLIFDCTYIQNDIIDTGFLPELSSLLGLYHCPDLQCHVAGTLRNLAAENRVKVNSKFLLVEYICTYMRTYIYSCNMHMYIHNFVFPHT